MTTATPGRDAPRVTWEYRGHHLVTEWDGYKGGYHVLYYPDYAADLRHEEIASRFADSESAEAQARRIVDAGEVTHSPVPAEVMTPSRRTYGCSYLAPRDWDARTIAPNACPVVTGPRSGLEIERDPSGAWWVHTLRWPESQLTTGHATNHEAHWAAYALLDIAPWNVLVDIRGEVEGEPEPLAEARRRIAVEVARVGARFAAWRTQAPQGEPAATAASPVAGLGVVSYGRGNWAVCSRGVPVLRADTRKAAVEAARLLGEIANWELPAYVLGLDEALRAEICAVGATLAGETAVAAQARRRANDIRRNRGAI